MNKYSPANSNLKGEIDALGPWFHNLKIHGVQTAPDHFLGDFPSLLWEGIKHVLPEDLEGRSVLDVGCNAGFYSLEMKRRNAGQVVGIDSDAHYLKQARYAAEQAGVDIDYRQMSVYEVARLGQKFDLVIFMGVLYHLRHPLLALDLLHEHAVGEQMLFQCLQRGDERVLEPEYDYGFSEWDVFDRPEFPKLFFVEKSYAADPTNWFVPNKSAVEALLRDSGFAIRSNPTREVYLCDRKDPTRLRDIPDFA